MSGLKWRYSVNRGWRNLGVKRANNVYDNNAIKKSDPQEIS